MRERSIVVTLVNNVLPMYDDELSRIVLDVLKEHVDTTLSFNNHNIDNWCIQSYDEFESHFLAIVQRILSKTRKNKQDELLELRKRLPKDQHGLGRLDRMNLVVGNISYRY